FLSYPLLPPHPPSFPTRRSSDLLLLHGGLDAGAHLVRVSRRVEFLGRLLLDQLLRQFELGRLDVGFRDVDVPDGAHLAGEQQSRSEEHTSELQSQSNLVCRLLLE